MAITAAGLYICTPTGGSEGSLILKVTGASPFLVAKGYDIGGHALVAPDGAPDISDSAEIPVSALLSDSFADGLEPSDYLERHGPVAIKAIVNDFLMALYNSYQVTWDDESTDELLIADLTPNE